MTRKRTGYDAACYYDGKLLGRCTKADSDAYTLLMNACGGDAARVLREYAYFSPELKAILEKAALMQANRNRTGGMFHAPRSSPWGEVQNCEVLCPGVFLVSTASHGGTMVANEVAAVLSPAAKKCGFKVFLVFGKNVFASVWNSSFRGLHCGRYSSLLHRFCSTVDAIVYNFILGRR